VLQEVGGQAGQAGVPLGVPVVPLGGGAVMVGDSPSLTKSVMATWCPSTLSIGPVDS
jgi:hypothetical protein